MAENRSVMFEWSWAEVSVLGSQGFGQASMEGCEEMPKWRDENIYQINLFVFQSNFFKKKVVKLQTYVT